MVSGAGVVGVAVAVGTGVSDAGGSGVFDAGGSGVGDGMGELVGRGVLLAGGVGDGNGVSVGAGVFVGNTTGVSVAVGMTDVGGGINWPGVGGRSSCARVRVGTGDSVGSGVVVGVASLPIGVLVTVGVAEATPASEVGAVPHIRIPTT